MDIAPVAALVFLLFAGPVAVYVAWSDMARMKIPNQAVVATAVIYAICGPFVLSLADYGWGYVQLVVVLVLGFVLNLGGAMGAGDAKYAAAIIPFVAFGDIGDFFILFAAVLIAAFATHRLARASKRIRALTPEWESWTSTDFPMGLALAGTLLIYLLLGGVSL